LNFEHLPNVFLIGAAKCGTTALADTLKRHPQVYVPFAKEPMFFSDDRQYHGKGLQWYCDTYYSIDRVYPVRMDASTPYLHWSEKTAGRIQEAYRGRKIRFIAIFRDPVARAYSHYWHARRYGRETLTFEEAIQKEESRLKENWETFSSEGRQVFGYVRGGMYAQNLTPYLDLFPREDFHFMLLDDLRDDFQAQISSLQSFLEIEQIELEQAVSNQAGQPILNALNRYLNKPHHHLKRIFRFIPFSIRHQIKQKAMNINIRRQTNPPMPTDVKAQLREWFFDDIRRLEMITNRDLSQWYPQNNNQGSRTGQEHAQG